jgi:alpha-beta hydrolase superfamily lysophospholipase
VAQAFNAAGYSLYGYDMRGQGRSEGTRGHTPSYEHLLDDLSLVIAAAQQETKSQKIFLYGHSMGANITLNYGLRRAMQNINGFIVTGAQLRLAFVPPPLQVALARFMVRLMPTYSQKANLDINTISRDPAVRAAYQADPLRGNVITAKLFLEVMDASAYALTHAAEFKAPLLMLHGGSDGLVLAKGAQEFYEQAASTDKTFKQYEGLLHEIHNEPEKQTVFNDMIAWLNKH